MKDFLGLVRCLLCLSLLINVGQAVADEGAVHDVVIPDGVDQFTPAIISISAGETVRWINNDTKQPSHDFASLPGTKPENKELKVIELKSGEMFEHTFSRPGEYIYFCYIHKGMIGKVVVK